MRNVANVQNFTVSVSVMNEMLAIANQLDMPAWQLPLIDIVEGESSAVVLLPLPGSIYITAKHNITAVAPTLEEAIADACDQYRKAEHGKPRVVYGRRSYRIRNMH